jgi:hypothetical protein
MRRRAYQTAADEQNGDGDMLQVLGAPFATRAAEMLEEDVGRAVEEDEGALDKLGRRTPFLTGLPGTDVPGLGKSVSHHLDIVDGQGTNPSEIAKTAGPAAESEDAQPEEDASLDPVRQAAEDALALLDVR